MGRLEQPKGNVPIPPERRTEAITRILGGGRWSPGQAAQIMDQMNRNGRWGTCVLCPDAEGRIHGGGRNPYQIFPENCPETDRYDHWLGVDVLDK